MSYRVIENYYRQEVHEHFRSYRNPFYSVSFKLQFSRLRAFLDQRGYRTYLNLCYFFTRAMQPIEDFRYRRKNGAIVLYDRIHPGLTVPAAGGLFSFVHLEYLDDVESFNADATLPSADQAPNLASEEDTNYIYFTAIPGIPFDTFTHATDSPEDGAPRVAFGKPFKEASESWVSVGIQVNHAFVDGRALGELYENAVECFGNPR